MINMRYENVEQFFIDTGPLHEAWPTLDDAMMSGDMEEAREILLKHIAIDYNGTAEYVYRALEVRNWYDWLWYGDWSVDDEIVRSEIESELDFIDAFLSLVLDAYEIPMDGETAMTYVANFIEYFDEITEVYEVEGVEIDYARVLRIFVAAAV